MKKFQSAVPLFRPKYIYLCQHKQNPSHDTGLLKAKTTNINTFSRSRKRRKKKLMKRYDASGV
jgi:hypothetical protein